MNYFALIEKYLALAVVGVKAAASVPNASNTDKKTAVLNTVVAVGDAVSSASADPKVVFIGAMIDVAASVINTLTTKTAAAVPVAPTSPAIQVIKA